MDWRWPDWIIYPTGGGTGMIGMWKAFAEIERIGWVKPQRRPRMVSVQAEGCAPVVRAYQQGAENAQPWEGAATLADGLRVPRAIGDFLILRAVRRAAHGARRSDRSMVDGMSRSAAEGVSAAPEGGAALAAIEQLVADGSIAAADVVVLFNTGGALKYLDVIN
jgi:threonine synthase